MYNLSKKLEFTHKSMKMISYTEGTIFMIFIYTWDLVVQYFNPQSQYILTFLPVGIIISYLYLYIIIHNKINLYKFIFADIIQILCIASLVFGILWNFNKGDIEGVLNTSLFWLSILSFRIFSAKFPVSDYSFVVLLIIVIIPYIIMSDDPLIKQNLIPHIPEWKAFIISVHFSGILGGIFIISALNAIQWQEKQKYAINITKYAINIMMIFFGILLVFFSQSRTAFLATVIPVILGTFFYKKVHRIILFFITVFTIILIYYLIPVIQGNLELISGFNNPFIKNFFKLDNVQSGISSGREWLWGYHINIFFQYPFTGGPKELLTFKAGDFINGKQALASSESFLTWVLAKYGVWGMSYHIFLLILLWNSLKSDSKGLYLITTFSIIFCAGTSLLGNPYGAHNTGIYLFLFSQFYIQKIKF